MRALTEWYRRLKVHIPQEPDKVLLDACVLEDRVLYSATALPLDADPSGSQAWQVELSQQEVDALMTLLEVELNPSAPDDQAASVLSLNPAQAAFSSSTDILPAATPDGTHHAVAFVDAHLDDLNSFDFATASGTG